jgi:general nucleoside transport system ATP-binding protein
MQVEVRDLTKTFGALRANDAISLRFGAGQIHGVLGENGAGKSTLMKLLSGYLRADSGSILLDGEPVLLRSPADALAAGVGMIHQDPLDVPAFTALENFFLGSLPATMPDMATARKLLTTIAGQFGFAVPPDAPLARLTVGQRQQLELMRLLAWGARVLILDEPTTGITAAQATALFEAVRRLADSGATVLFVSHKLDEVAALCHTVSVLRAGQVVGEQMAMPQPQGRLLQLMFGEGASQEEEEEIGSVSSSPLLSFSSSGPIWRLRGIIAREDNLELHVPALDIARGALIGLAGLEGSGQRVLLRLLSGRLKPLAGRVLVGDADLTGQRGEVFRRSGVEHLPADRLDDGVVGAFSLAEHFALQAPYLPGAAGEKHGGLLLDRQAARSAAEQAIAAYAIRGTPDTPLISLSGGNQQRAMLALLPERISGLLLEQPTRGLDVASARSVWGKLLERRAAGTALMFASADLDELLEYAEHVLVFFAGRVSPLIPRAELSYARLAKMIGGVGFETMNAEG